jgi:hypothetical protein
MLAVAVSSRRSMVHYAQARAAYPATCTPTVKLGQSKAGWQAPGRLCFLAFALTAPANAPRGTLSTCRSVRGPDFSIRASPAMEVFC